MAIKKEDLMLFREEKLDGLKRLQDDRERAVEKVLADYAVGEARIMASIDTVDILIAKCDEESEEL